MKKIHLILIGMAGIVSFSGSFGVNWYLKKNEPILPETPAAAQAGVTTGSAQSNLPDILGSSDSSLQEGMSERQLQNLIHEVRERMNYYRGREKDLAVEAERIETAHKVLQTDVDQLNQLRSKIAVLMQELEEKEKALQASILEINALEKKNFERLAATYDKMDTTQAGVILANMSSGAQISDAVKILYYMSERTSAKIIGEIGTSRPELAAMISLQLKRVKEGG